MIEDSSAPFRDRELTGAARKRPLWHWIAALFAVLFVVGAIPRIRTWLELRDAVDAAVHAAPLVSVVTPQPAPAAELTLPGTTQPDQQATIYARVDGYLEQRLVDIGDRVQAGDLLAVISAPTVDQQLAQARADLVRAKADLGYARSTLQRYEAADRDGAVAKEDLDQRRNAVHTADAAVQAGNATVQQLAEQQRFERVTAPFAGVVTQRNLDVGALITAGSSSSTTPLYTIAKNDPIRVFIDVPQPFVDEIRVGQPASVRTRSLPDHPFTGTIARLADALDVATRTMRTEVDVPNPDGALKPGMYVQVALEGQRVGTRWRVPASAVIFDAKGTQLAIVGAERKIEIRPVSLGRDFGSAIEIASGLKGDETVVSTPSAVLANGLVVEPVQAKP
jgi:RND family efflux transporter MFP subunit